MTTYSAVVTTGIYCRPGCGARPLEQNTRTFDQPAAAEAAGFRACYRCRPYRVAGPVSATAPELVCEAVQQIINGALDDGGTEQKLAASVGMSARHLRRLFLQHLGASPDQLARSRRAHFARRLLDDTDLTVLEIAFASGFGSLRQFNRIMREVFRAAPADLRERRQRADRLAADGGLTLRLPVSPGYDWNAVRAFLAARLIPGVEQVDGDTYRRTITVADAPGLLEVTSKDKDCLLLRVHLPYWEGLIHVVDRVGLLLGVHTDFSAGVTALLGDRTLGPLIVRRPGLVIPGAWNPYEIAVQERLSRTELGEFVRRHGTPVPGLPGDLTHTFPSRVAEYSVPSEYVALRQGRRDAFPLTHPSLRAALTDLGLDSASPPDNWRPWLALAATHLIAHGDTLAGQREVVAASSAEAGLTGAGRPPA
jgi:AraC family transcriptional regulator, regulatory protein of adaptative response / DNA-3-methyladenine glycosylase II